MHRETVIGVLCDRAEVVYVCVVREIVEYELVSYSAAVQLFKAVDMTLLNWTVGPSFAEYGLQQSIFWRKARFDYEVRCGLTDVAESDVDTSLVWLHQAAGTCSQSLAAVLTGIQLTAANCLVLICLHTVVIYFKHIPRIR